MVTYLVKRVSRAFEDHVPEEEVVVVLETDAGAQIVVVLDVCGVSEWRLTSELLGEDDLSVMRFNHLN